MPRCALAPVSLLARGYATCSVRGAVLVWWRKDMPLAACEMQFGLVALTRRNTGAALGHSAIEVDGRAEDDWHVHVCMCRRMYLLLYYHRTYSTSVAINRHTINALPLPPTIFIRPLALGPRLTPTHYPPILHGCPTGSLRSPDGEPGATGGPQYPHCGRPDRPH